MKQRLYALLLVGVLTFNQAGMIVFAEDGNRTQQTVMPMSVEGTVTTNKTLISAEGESVRFTISEGEFPKNYSVEAEDGTVLKAGEDYTESVRSGDRLYLAIGANKSSAQRTLYLVIEGQRVASVQQRGAVVDEAKISAVTKVSQDVLEDGKTQVVYKVSGENLKEVGIKVKEGFTNVSSKKYTVKRTGNGAEQVVTITFTPNTEEFDWNYSIQFYKSVDSLTVEKTEKITISPYSGGTIVKPEISSVSVDKTETKWNEGTVEMTVQGTNLTSDLEVSVVNSEGKDAGATVGKALGTAIKQTFTVTLPENTSADAQKYTIRVKVKGQTDEQTVDVTVKGKVVDTEGKVGTVTAVQVTPDSVDKAGGTVQLRVTGTNLTAENWGVQVKTYIAGAVMEMTSKYPAKVTNITAEGATITIPENRMVNELEYRIVAGAVKNGVIQEQAKASVKQSASEKKTELVFVEAYLEDENTVVAEFEKEISIAGTAEELKAKIALVGYQGEGVAAGMLGAGDSVKVEGKKLTITLGNKYNATASSQITIDAGALVVAGGTTNKTATHMLTSKPTVKQINFDKDVYDYKGGKVVAKLAGVRVNELAEGSVVATIINPGTLEKYSLLTTVKYGIEPAVEFVVPENTTDKTQSYLLSLTVNGQNVYEVDGTNLARRAIVSVLPKGMDETAQTISSVTITGNNKLDMENTTNITVTVEEQVGSLKTVLRLSGTNLDSTKTAVRAIDENGVIWPVYHIPECDGSWRFVAIDGVHKNGVIGDGNSQFVEVLPPRYAGTNKTYTLQIALDGENFLDAPTVTLTVNNEKVKGQDEEWVECGKDDVITITAKYIDQKTGKEIATADTYKGYAISMYDQFNIGAKSIEGYTLVSGPNMDEYNGHFYREFGKSEFVFVYTANTTENPEQPSNPDQPVKPDDKRPTSTDKTKNDTVKTGDGALVLPYALAMVTVAAGVGATALKKREDK